MQKKNIKNSVLILGILAIGFAFSTGYIIGLQKTPIPIYTQPITPTPTAVTIETPYPAPIISLPALKICFSPQQNCEAVIVDTIHQAQESIYIQAYSFTSKPIVHALIMAQQRGVKIQIILDAKTKVPPYVTYTGLSIYMEKMPGLAHNKVMIIDGKIVLTGSYNFTKAAKYRNAENLIKIEDLKIAQKYLENWQLHFKRTQQTSN